ncbi:MAG TPA: carboxypeptidase-like regulatory domain-containing protein [Gemmatimonadaceae bacterium]|nr:carboxypeptidase-like regulatory domain-containing protein [Gemmatimonadaceae bacterium]
MRSLAARGRQAACVAAPLFIPRAVRAQTVRGTVVDSTDRPVDGVVVQLTDSASHVAARALSSERGEFRLSAQHAGTYRIRTLRIGFHPVLSEPVTLLAGGEITQRIVVPSLPIGLDTMRIASQNVCRAFDDSGAATYAVWEQIRTALTVSRMGSDCGAVVIWTRRSP